MGSIIPSTSYVQDRGRTSLVTYDAFLSTRTLLTSTYVLYCDTEIVETGFGYRFVDALTVPMCVDSVNRSGLVNTKYVCRAKADCSYGFYFGSECSTLDSVSSL